MTNVQRSRRQVRLSRALGIALTPKAQRIFEKRPYAPGEHGRTRRRTESDYAVRLREKQRLRAQYGISEKQLRAAYEKGTHTAGQTGNAMLSDLVPVQDTAKALSTRMGARRNWKKFADGDLVAPSTNFPPAVRQYLLADYQQVMASAKAISPTYIHARYADPAPSAFDNADDAQAEIDRIGAVYETQRWFYSTEVALDGVPDIDLGQIWRLVYPLYGLESGKNVMVVTYQPDFVNNTAQITLWG